MAAMAFVELIPGEWVQTLYKHEINYMSTVYIITILRKKPNFDCFKIFIIFLRAWWNIVIYIFPSCNQGYILSNILLHNWSYMPFTLVFWTDKSYRALCFFYCLASRSENPCTPVEGFTLELAAIYCTWIVFSPSRMTAIFLTKWITWDWL
jgi:hypothetical protein